MNHVPFRRSPNSVLARIKVPAFSPGFFTEPWDGVPAFRDDLNKKGASVAMSRNLARLRGKYVGTDHDLSEEDEQTCMTLICLIQRWLYFGLLQDAFARSGFEMHWQEWVDEVEEDKYVLNSTVLTRHIYHWFVLESEQDDTTSGSNMCFVAQSLYAVNSLLKQFEDEKFVEIMDRRPLSQIWKAEDDEHDRSSIGYLDPFSCIYPRAATVMLSIRVLVETLANCLYPVFSGYDTTKLDANVYKLVGDAVDRAGHFIPDPKELLTNAPQEHFMDQLLSASGFCPHEIAFLRDKVSLLSQLYFLSGNSRPAVPSKGCQRCPVAKLEEATYTQRHRPNCQV